MLTASGFRQHYLIGHELHQRYMKDHPDSEQLLSPIYNSDEVYVRSTQVQRTIQSANAQLLGLYPLGTAEFLKPEQIQNSIPHINISDKEEILELLGVDAIQRGFQPVPVHNFNLNVDSLIAYGGCPFIVNDYLRRAKDPQIWQKLDDYYRPLIFNQIAAAFNLSSEDLKFIDIYQYTDVLFAEDFEGIQTRYNFTEEEWDIVLEIQIPLLIQLLSDVSNQIISLRYIFPIIELMKAKIGLDYNQTLVQVFGDPKFVLFSSHDYQMAHILKFLQPNNYDLHHIEYASIILFELHRKETRACLSSKSES